MKPMDRKRKLLFNLYEPSWMFWKVLIKLSGIGYAHNTCKKKCKNIDVMCSDGFINISKVFLLNEECIKLKDLRKLFPGPSQLSFYDFYI